MNLDTTTMFRPIGPGEHDLLVKNEFAAWPPRLPGQPIFYPVANVEYARQITREWNVRTYGIGWVTSFNVCAAFASRYPIQKVGGTTHTEWWIPSEDLQELNRDIVGKITVPEQWKE